tara:strand:+ start:920 stop:1228 length:309 start_codon:yes stop_codon:yes gene_type:complete
MAFPLNPSIGDFYTDPNNNTLEYVSEGAWALVGTKGYIIAKRVKDYIRVEEQLDLLWHMMDDETIPGKDSSWYNVIKEVKVLHNYPAGKVWSEAANSWIEAV